jgi:F0F1-type ATP synthase membrane subunit b/b'
MRVWILTLVALVVALVTFSLVGCSREDADKGEREFGKAAYKTKQASEKAATRAAHELNRAGRQAREGWKEAKENQSHDGSKDRRKDTRE